MMTKTTLTMMINSIKPNIIVLVIITFKIDFCLTVHHQLGKVIQKNQLDATMIY